MMSESEMLPVELSDDDDSSRSDDGEEQNEQLLRGKSFEEESGHKEPSPLQSSVNKKRSRYNIDGPVDGLATTKSRNSVVPQENPPAVDLSPQNLSAGAKIYPTYGWMSGVMRPMESEPSSPSTPPQPTAHNTRLFTPGVGYLYHNNKTRRKKQTARQPVYYYRNTQTNEVRRVCDDVLYVGPEPDSDTSAHKHKKQRTVVPITPRVTRSKSQPKSPVVVDLAGSSSDGSSAINTAGDASGDTNSGPQLAHTAGPTTDPLLSSRVADTVNIVVRDDVAERDALEAHTSDSDTEDSTPYDTMVKKVYTSLQGGVDTSKLHTDDSQHAAHFGCNNKLQKSNQESNQQHKITNMQVIDLSNEWETGSRKRPVDLSSDGELNGTEVAAKKCKHRDVQQHLTDKTTVVDLTGEDDAMAASCVSTECLPTTSLSDSTNEATSSSDKQTQDVGGVDEISTEESKTDILVSEIDDFVDSLADVTTITTNTSDNITTPAATPTTTSSSTTTTTPSFQVYLTSTEYAHRHTDYKPHLGLSRIQNYVGQAVMNGRIHHAFQFRGSRDRNFPPQCAVLDINDPRLPRFVIVHKDLRKRRYKAKKGNNCGSGGGSESDSGEVEPITKRMYRGPFDIHTTPTPTTPATPTANIISRCDTPPVLESTVLRNIEAIRFASKLMDHLVFNGTILPVNWADYTL